jgi:hypothetical protein
MSCHEIVSTDAVILTTTSNNMMDVTNLWGDSNTTDILSTVMEV